MYYRDNTKKNDRVQSFRLCKANHDHALKFVYLLIHSSSPATSTLPMNRHYLTADDWDYLVQDIIDTHPGLKFLREAKEFHLRYIKTVVARAYYNCNRSWSGKLTVQEIRRSNFIQVHRIYSIFHFALFRFSYRHSIDLSRRMILIVSMITSRMNISMLFTVNSGN